MWRTRKYVLVLAVFLAVLAGCAGDSSYLDGEAHIPPANNNANEYLYERECTTGLGNDRDDEPCEYLHETGYTARQNDDNDEEILVGNKSYTSLNLSISWAEMFNIMRTATLSSHADFSDMKYSILTVRTVGLFTASDNWHEYAIINQSTPCFEYGHALYEKLNSPITIRHAPFGDYADTEEPGLIRLLFERHIVDISSDGMRMLASTYQGTNLTPNYLFEVIEDEIVIWDYLLYDEWWFPGHQLSHKFGFHIKSEYDPIINAYTNIDTGEIFSLPGDVGIFNRNETHVAFIQWENRKFTVRIYDIENADVIFSSELFLPVGVTELLFFDDGHVIFHDCFNYYSLCIESSQLTHMFTKPIGVISPDGRYLAYSSAQPVDFALNPEETQGLYFGIYIVDITSGKTMFIPITLQHDYGSLSGYGIIGWTMVARE